jgi:hypothetical protein
MDAHHDVLVTLMQWNQEGSLSARNVSLGQCSYLLHLLKDYASGALVSLSVFVMCPVT